MDARGLQVGKISDRRNAIGLSPCSGISSDKLPCLLCAGQTAVTYLRQLKYLMPDKLPAQYAADFTGTDNRQTLHASTLTIPPDIR